MYRRKHANNTVYLVSHPFNVILVTYVTIYTNVISIVVSLQMCNFEEIFSAQIYV